MMGKTLLLGIAVCTVGCGGDSGEPIEGTITIGYGDDMIALDVGAALRGPSTPPAEMLVLLGTSGLHCGLDFETDNPSGYFIEFQVDSTTPATHNDASIAVIRNTSTSFSLNGSTGTVVIDSIGTDRVTGSVTFSTTDDEVGPITAMGTFDVIRCF